MTKSVRNILVNLVAALIVTLSGWQFLDRRTMVIHAQSLPITKTIAWDANPTTDIVTKYTFWLDTGPKGDVFATSPLIAFITFTTTGPHTIHLTATNPWGESPEATLTVNVVVLARPTGLRIQ